MDAADRVPKLLEEHPEWAHEATEYLKRCYPFEGCGIFSATGFKPIENIHADPTQAFEMPPEVWLENQIEGVIHSHPDGNNFPSKMDMQQQIATDVPWAICKTTADSCSRPIWFGDQLPVAPLVGREFVYGIYDCYSLIRDWYRSERGTVLAEFPRDWGWWETGESSMYEEGFMQAGFEVFDPQLEPLQVGDVFLAKLRYSVTNHGGVYVGDGAILHHIQNSLSRRTPLNPWAGMIEKWVRYKG